ncbi:MAG: hypothetical protein CL565_04265 [Alphaproteobacteria bacterium]|mgnify:CR=1 FL=1|nr:hypothetical protein [Alphaproteobacteria bacterium]|tara:strand:+ start:800 stop:1303 length:504 start_codon:yes stop_codon:yes gene_type:complete
MSKSDVKIIHRKNKLKAKAGGEGGKSGYIDPNAVARGQASIEKQEENYADEVEIILTKIDSAWDDLKSELDDPKKEKQNLSTLHNYANNIKDIAKTFNYELMSYFGESLRDFCEKLNARNPVHQVIVKAHIDVMWAAFKTNIKGEGSKEAEELKVILNKAIEKHSKI